MNKPIIEFNGYKIEKINYKSMDFSDKDDMSEVEIKNVVECGINDEQTKGLVVVKLSVIDPRNSRELEIEVSGFFDLSPDIKEEEEAYQYLSVNGVAIVYPYVRTFASMLTTLDSDKAIVLPSVNTKEFYETFDNK